MKILPEEYAFAARIGFIILQPGLGRKQYIKACLEQGSVCVRTTRGAIIHGVKVSQEVLSNLVFPTGSKNTGTPVLFLDMPGSKPVVIASFEKPDEMPDTLAENSFNLVRRSGRNSVNISGQAEDGILQMAVAHEQKATIAIVVKSEDKDGSFTLSVQGNTHLDTTKTVTIHAGDTIALKARNGKERKGLSIGKDKAAEPAVLGNTLSEILQELLTAIQAITVQTALGPSSTPINMTDFQKIAKKINNIKSKIVTLD